MLKLNNKFQHLYLGLMKKKLIKTNGQYLGLCTTKQSQMDRLFEEQINQHIKQMDNSSL